MDKKRISGVFITGKDWFITDKHVRKYWNLVTNKLETQPKIDQIYKLTKKETKMAF